MRILQTLLPDTFLLQTDQSEDARGNFRKTYHLDTFKKLGIEFEIHEEFYSFSKKNVLRGMHFQLPPNQHEKLVYCANGEVLDVLLDLRKEFNYGQVVATKLSSTNGHMIFIPKGVAHGFLSLTDDAMVVYKTSTVHNPKSDMGILWSSFNFDWFSSLSDPITPILSERDKCHPSFSTFISPF
jgi:dTDP-4-dehydrorhamnose 3,5-epimerase